MQVTELRRRLLKKGIDTQLDDLSACSALKMFSRLNGRCPVSEDIAGKGINIPNGHNVTEEDISYIIDCLREIVS